MLIMCRFCRVVAALLIVVGGLATWKLCELALAAVRWMFGS